MDTRHFDLEELYDARKKATNSTHREYIDSKIERIMRESGAVRSKREELLRAIRNDDRRAVHRFQYELMMMRANETYGKDY